MPVYAFITHGTKAEKKTINPLAFNPTPIHMIVIGIQDTGGIGRRISNMGLINLSNPLYHPINRPNGIPIIIANKNPV
jgi:hypothetical protein